MMKTTTFNKIDVERYVMRGYTPKKGYTIEKKYVYTGAWGVFWSSAIWVLFNVIAKFNDKPFGVFIPNTLLILLIPITIFITIKRSKLDLSTINNSNQAESVMRIKIASAIGAVVGLVIARFVFPMIDQSTISIIISAGAITMVLLFTFVACASFYRVYLIHKYCPHLRKRE